MIIKINSTQSDEYVNRPDLQVYLYSDVDKVVLTIGMEDIMVDKSELIKVLELLK